MTDDGIPARADGNWDHRFDVVVVGSGAGGMLAAICAHDFGQSVVVMEKADVYGGTTAISGGAVWVPCNHQIRELGGIDSREDTLAYLKAATRGMVSEARLNAYLDTAPQMVRYLEAKTRMRYRAMPHYSDYYPDLAGAKGGYRTMDPVPFDAAKLGSEFERLRPPSPGTLIAGRVGMTAGEAHTILAKERGWMLLIARRFARYWLDVRWRRRTRRDRRSHAWQRAGRGAASLDGRSQDSAVAEHAAGIGACRHPTRYGRHRESEREANSYRGQSRRHPRSRGLRA